MSTPNLMNYKGYIARVEYSPEDDCFVGHLMGINDIIGFHADSVSQLHVAFEEAVDDYLDACKKANRTPQRSYSGRILLRVSPETHAKAVIAAKSHGMSLNAWTENLLAQAQ